MQGFEDNIRMEVRKIRGEDVNLIKLVWDKGTIEDFGDQFGRPCF
jgi:hypothetical protein